ncbi:MAG: hypothetical protein K2K21_12785 [Lachnospiraceae bacterium]|nr:hypothetical protein [Lachnospiraceae bacterium]
MSENSNLSENVNPDSSLKVQKTTYIKQQMERQRAAEDARLEYLMKEQEVIDGLRETIDDSMWQTEDVRKYNQEFQEQINMQIYEAHGITADKLTGMKEYKNALYRGAATVMFLLSLALTILCGALFGFKEDVCILMFAYTAVEGTLLFRKEKQLPILDIICRVLYMLIFPVMLGMFVCFALEYEAYEFLLQYAVIFGVLVTLAGTLSYFIYDPYRQDKKKVQDAKKNIRDIERTVEKEVRKEQKEIRREQKIREKGERKFWKFLKHFKQKEDTEQNVSEQPEQTLSIVGENVAEEKVSEENSLEMKPFEEEQASV